MTRYIKFNILILAVCLSFTIKAQQNDSQLTDNSIDELNAIVDDLVNQARDQSRLSEFKNLKKLVSKPFNSTPLFLQTLESLKLAEEKKNEIFARYLPRVTSSVGGGVKSGGLNNKSSSQSYNLNVTQLVYDFGVTKRQLSAATEEALASQSKVESQRTDLLLAIISAVHELYRAEMQLRLSQGFVDARKGFLDSTKQREELGGSSNADVIRAETKLSEALDKIPLQVRILKDSQAKLLEFFINETREISLTRLPVIAPEAFSINEDTVNKNFKIS